MHGESGVSAADWETIRAALLEMVREDQAMRDELDREGTLFDGYHPRMEAVHRRNAEHLSGILAAHGWPGRSRVGEEGAAAAWLILQHAIGDPELMRRGLPLLTAAAARGDASAVHAAMLEDRIRTLEGRPQRYATQFDWDERGELGPLPIEDPARVEERRREVGLPPLAADLLRRREDMASGRERPPADWGARRRRLDDWLREAGWRESP
jgi:hypothetical protein